MRKSVPWHHFETVRADLAASGQRLLFRDDWQARALLETGATGAAPRSFPVFPVLSTGELWLLIVDRSPAYRDLQAHPEVVLRTLQTAREEDEFLLRGVAEEVHDAERKGLVVAASGARGEGSPFEALFRVRIRSVLHTVWVSPGTERSWPAYHRWQS